MSKWEDCPYLAPLIYEGEGPYHKEDEGDSALLGAFLISFAIIAGSCMFFFFFFQIQIPIDKIMAGDFELSKDFIGTGIFVVLNLIAIVLFLRKLNVVYKFEPGNIHLDKIYLTPGTMTQVEYTRRIKRQFNVSHLELVLMAEEYVEWRRGTNTHTETELIFEKSFGNKTVSLSKYNPEMRGHWSIKIPQEIEAYSFYASRNEVRWKYKVNVFDKSKLLEDSFFEINIVPFEE